MEMPKSVPYTVCVCLQSGADVNVCNHRGNTALHEASDHGQKSIVMTLLDFGADPNIRNRLTKTAFNLARVHTQTTPVQFM